MEPKTMNLFLRPIETYKRDYNMIGHYQRSMTKAIALATNTSPEYIRPWLEEKMKNDWAPKSPEMNVLSRPVRGDRKKTKVDLLGYLKWVTDSNSIMAPNLIAYADPEVEEAFTSGFIISNLKQRKTVKQEGQAAKQQGDDVKATFCNLLQANFKIRNNSISGALSSPYNPLYYASSHTSLTSVCRAITSYANACNEKLMASNRHYFSPDITLENIAYIVGHADLLAVEEAMLKYKLIPPTVDYTYQMVLRSTSLYWQDDNAEEMILNMIKNMTRVERTAFCFIGDLNALQETNDKAMRKLYDLLIGDPEPVTDEEQQGTIIKGASDDYLSLATLLCVDFMKGKSAKKLPPYEKSIWTGRLKRINDVLTEYKMFIDAFISAHIMPGSIHSLPTIIRRCVVGSDTDSSIYSTQRQVGWYVGRIDYSDRAIRAGAVTGFFASQHIVHTLAMLSGNMNTGRKELFRLNMKPEFMSLAQANLGNITKHYAMDLSACEGNMFDKPKMELKGVNLKSSKLPTAIHKEIEKFCWYLLSLPAKEVKVSPMEPAAIMATIEHRIKNHLLAGESSFFKTEQIKTPETYASETAAQTVCCNLWNDVFGETYGFIEELPADCLKVNVALGKEKDIVAWGATLTKAQERALKEFCLKWNKKNFTQLLVPIDLIEDDKIHKEVLGAIDLRKMLYSLVQPFYLLSNSINLNIANSKLTRFWSDDITLEEAQKWVPSDYKIDL